MMLMATAWMAEWDEPEALVWMRVNATLSVAESGLYTKEETSVLLVSPCVGVVWACGVNDPEVAVSVAVPRKVVVITLTR